MAYLKLSMSKHVSSTMVVSSAHATEKSELLNFAGHVPAPNTSHAAGGGPPVGNTGGEHY